MRIDTNNIDIQIIYEDKDVVVVNKPSGLVVHMDGKTSEPTLTDWVVERYPETANVGEPLNLLSTSRQSLVTMIRPGIVHRLDRETSGVLIIAKNQKMFENLKNQFKNREIIKVYRAFVYGEMKLDEGIINRSIGKSKRDFRLWSAQRGARGTLREAETLYTVLEKQSGYSYIEVRPKTGRTHQIRVHFKAINYPVVCDKLYAPTRECALGFTRLALHASSITFVNLKGKQVTVEAPLPSDFVRALKQVCK